MFLLKVGCGSGIDHNGLECLPIRKLVFGKLLISLVDIGRADTGRHIQKHLIPYFGTELHYYLGYQITGLLGR